MLDKNSTTTVNVEALYRSMPKGVEFNKLRKRLLRLTEEALNKYGMVSEGTRWLVALSGGKDSYGLLALIVGFEGPRAFAGRIDRVQS